VQRALTSSSVATGSVCGRGAGVAEAGDVEVCGAAGLAVPRIGSTAANSAEAARIQPAGRRAGFTLRVYATGTRRQNPAADSPAVAWPESLR